MTVAGEQATSAGGGWRKLAVLALALAAIGLPVNNLVSYVPLLIAAVVIFNGEVSARGRSWVGALAVIAAVIAAQVLFAPPRIEEGHTTAKRN